MNEYFQIINKKDIENLNISSKLLTQAFGKEKINYRLFNKIIKKNQKIIKGYLNNPLFFNSSYDLFPRDKKNIDENKITHKNNNNFLNKKQDFHNSINLNNNLND